VGSGSKQNIFYVSLRDWGEETAIVTMWRLVKLCNVFNKSKGISLGLGDILPTSHLIQSKEKALNTQYVQDRKTNINSDKLL